ncbi:MAG: NAD(+) synthase [Actinomycetia bacterium]|nr:NAD(+) synthase [Actinomycetes bacterium]
MSAIFERLAVPNPGLLADELVGEIIKAVENGKKSGCVLGNSGGIDSALMAAIAIRALGKERVRLFFLPERDTNKQSQEDARLVAEKLGMPMQEVKITPILRKVGVYRLEPPAFLIPRSVRERHVLAMQEELRGQDGSVHLKMQHGGDIDSQRHLAFSNAKNRVRMTVLYKHAELTNSLVLGTCNRSEKMTGLFVKHGDGACDLAPIDHLYKTQVFELARHMGVPSEIVEKKPTGDLIPGITDEGVLGIKYAQLDIALAGLELGCSDEEIVAAGVTQSELDYTKALVEASEFTRHCP